MTKDISVSVKARLLNIAKSERRAFNTISLLYMQERLLYRLSISDTVFNSRMKDFYDIYTMAIKEEFDYETLKSAISETFNRRETNISNYSVIFTEDFITDQSRINQWKAFLKRINLTEKLEYSTVMNILEKFLKPIVEGIIEKKSSLHKWNKDNLTWILNE